MERGFDYRGRRAAGRPRKMTEEQVAVATQLYFAEGMPVREVADAIHVSHMTVWRAISRTSGPEAVNAFMLGGR